MPYLSDLWVADPNNAILYKISNDIIASSASSAPDPTAVCVDLDMVDVWVVNGSQGTVSQFNNGTRVKDISVGKNPMSICQDINGALWVTNYGSNTVSKIVNGVKTMDIQVGNGPRGVCSTPDGAVWVSNYLSNSVSKIVNNIIVVTIQVGNNPYGICADSFNNVFVANSVSNTVSKLTGLQKMLDINVGKLPQGICSDGEGTIWVTNYLSNSVSKIVASAVVQEIFVNNGPFAIDTIADGSVYVMNYLGNTLTKIENNEVVSTITVCYNPSGLGDFTGNQAYLLYKGSGNQSSTLTVSYNNLDSNLQQMLTNLANGVVTSDANVTHDNPNYPTVQAALNFLLYVQPIITAFSNSVNVAEIGSVVTNLTLNWAYNKAMQIQSIAGIGNIPIGTLTDTLSNLNITTNTNWALTASDTNNTQVTANTGIVFENKVYWGISSNPTVTNANILGFTSKFATNYDMDEIFNCSGGSGSYIYFTVPTAFALDTTHFKVGGLSDSDWVKTTMQFTNASGYTTSYDVFRSGNIQTGSSIEVVIA